MSAPRRAPRLTLLEARVAGDVLRDVQAMSADELEEHYGWTDLELDAWQSALAKCDAYTAGRLSRRVELALEEARR